MSGTGANGNHAGTAGGVAILRSDLSSQVRDGAASRNRTADNLITSRPGLVPRHPPPYIHADQRVARPGADVHKQPRTGMTGNHAGTARSTSPEQACARATPPGQLARCTWAADDGGCQGAVDEPPSMGRRQTANLVGAQRHHSTFFDVGQDDGKIRDQQGLVFVPRQVGHMTQQARPTALSCHAPPRGW